MARTGGHFFGTVEVDADQFVVPLLSVVPDGTLLFERPETVGFEQMHQFAEPQCVVNPFQSTAKLVRDVISPRLIAARRRRQVEWWHNLSSDLRPELQAHSDEQAAQTRYLCTRCQNFARAHRVVEQGRSEPGFAWLERHQPVARVGKSILLYYIPGPER